MVLIENYEMIKVISLTALYMVPVIFLAWAFQGPDRSTAEMCRGLEEII
jgi:hypothetical protein